jgi:hypothetical protein
MDAAVGQLNGVAMTLPLINLFFHFLFETDDLSKCTSRKLKANGGGDGKGSCRKNNIIVYGICLSNVPHALCLIVFSTIKDFILLKFPK